MDKTLGIFDRKEPAIPKVKSALWGNVHKHHEKFNSTLHFL